MKVETSYIAHDGTTFQTAENCLAYEKQLIKHDEELTAIDFLKKNVVLIGSNGGETTDFFESIVIVNKQDIPKKFFKEEYFQLAFEGFMSEEVDMFHYMPIKGVYIYDRIRRSYLFFDFEHDMINPVILHILANVLKNMES